MEMKLMGWLWVGVIYVPMQLCSPELNRGEGSMA